MGRRSAGSTCCAASTIGWTEAGVRPRAASFWPMERQSVAGTEGKWESSGSVILGGRGDHIPERKGEPLGRGARSLHLGAGGLVELAVVPHVLRGLLRLGELLARGDLDLGPARVLGLLLDREAV